MRTYVIEHPHNEASALVAIHNRQLLDAFGWDVAFWIASDERPVQKALAALGRRRAAPPHLHDGDERDGDPKVTAGWDVVRLRCRRSDASDDSPTEDCECLARAGAWIYVFGSQFGGKSGPLDPKRHFVARFNESTVRRKDRKLKAAIDVARPDFLLHRIINDALLSRNLKLLPQGPNAREHYIKDTLKKLPKRHRDAVRPGDRAINIEGATFLPNGRLLLGLRHPTTADGHPILVEIDGIDRAFEPGRADEVCVTRVFSLTTIGTRSRPAGVRELDQRGSTIHVLVGNLDSHSQESQVVADNDRADDAPSEHHTFELPFDDRTEVPAKLERRLAGESNVEGFALFEDGSTWYARDDEQICLNEAPGTQDARPASPRQRARRSGRRRG
jgi:hypothetical protein